MQNSHKTLKIGCIADDFTGAGDAASYLAVGGMSPLLVIWPCEKLAIPPECDAVVVALKSRSTAPAEAVKETLAAKAWLEQLGVEQYYFKYCSTFDSRPDGNIGPVCDALLRACAEHYTLLCPSMLSNGRTVRDGCLYVNGTPLAESHMKDHPLNPMWDSNIAALMQPQSAYPCFMVKKDLLLDEERLNAWLAEKTRDFEHFYLVPDFFSKEQGERIAERFGHLRLLTGGSELLRALFFKQGGSAKNGMREESPAKPRFGRLMLAGSCSVASKKQIQAWIGHGGCSAQIDLEALRRDETTYAKRLAEAFLANPQEDLLIFSAGENEGGEETAQRVERLHAAVAQYVLDRLPVERLIVAGGETSGAVTQRLGLRAFWVGDSVAPGVPILHPTDHASLRVVLKSGNFGADDFFITTLKE